MLYAWRIKDKYPDKVIREGRDAAFRGMYGVFTHCYDKEGMEHFFFLPDDENMNKIEVSKEDVRGKASGKYKTFSSVLEKYDPKTGETYNPLSKGSRLGSPYSLYTRPGDNYTMVIATEGEKKELTFKSNAAFSDFIRVELDGKTLDEKNYTVKEGSTVVTLKADYVATLSAGEHTIGIVSTSGTASTTFTVNAKAAVDNDTKSPQTGDNSHMALWIALLFVSGGLLTVTGVYSKKKRSAR